MKTFVFDEMFLYNLRKWYKEVFEEMEFDKNEDYISIKYKKDKLTYLTETIWGEVTDRVLKEYFIPKYEIDVDKEDEDGLLSDIEEALTNDDNMIRKIMNTKMKKKLIY